MVGEIDKWRGEKCWEDREKKKIPLYVIGWEEEKFFCLFEKKNEMVKM